jgi:hypothetical protein
MTNLETNKQYYIADTLPSPLDQRDIIFCPRVPPEEFKVTLDLLPNVEEVKNQLDAGSCVATGIAEQAEWLAKAYGISLDLSRMFLYTATLDYEGRLGQSGLFVRDAYKVAFKYGICPENGPDGYPYDTSKQAVRPPDSAYLKARETRLLRYESVVSNNGFSNYTDSDVVRRIKSALNEGMPVGIGLRVTQSIYSMTGPWRQQNYIKAGDPNSPIAGGHYMVIIGYDDLYGKFLVLNSWGPTWGDGGFGGFSYDIVSDFTFEAWVIRDFNGWKVPEAPGIKFEGINRFRLTARIVPELNEIGTTTNIWMGVRPPDASVTYLRSEITPEQLSADFASGTDNWYPYVSGPMLPTVRNVTLQQDTFAVIVQFRNLSTLAGWNVYMTYGQDDTTWKPPVKICTIPNFD